MTRTRILAISLAATGLLAACGGSSTSDSSNESVPSTTMAAGFNVADVMFAQMMIPHHEQAIEMSDIALDPTVGAGDAVKSLASRIKGAQDPEIVSMKGMLTAWGQSLTMDESMDHGDMMGGMMTTEELAALSSKRGADFDRAWIEAMIAHHEGAVDMAKTVLKDGTNAQVRSLAEAITAAQQTEIDEMRGLLG